MKGEDPRFALAVDIGGTKVDIALIDSDGKLLGEINTHLVPFDKNGVASPERLLDLIEQIPRDLGVNGRPAIHDYVDCLGNLFH